MKQVVLGINHKSGIHAMMPASQTADSEQL